MRATPNMYAHTYLHSLHVVRLVPHPLYHSAVSGASDLQARGKCVTCAGEAVVANGLEGGGQTCKRKPHNIFTFQRR